MSPGRGNRIRRSDDRTSVTPHRPTHALRRAISVAAVVGTAALAACGSSGGDGGLSEQGARGRQIANSNGCASCHGPDGQGGTGPAWIGLAGSEVTLEDGRVVVADDAYLEAAITDPDADIVEGFLLKMPENSLSSDQVADIVAYINDLRDAGEAADG